MTMKQIFTAVLGASVAMLLLLSSCQPKKTSKYLGLQLYSVRDSMKSNTKGTIEAVGEMGYKFVEPAGYSDGKFYGMPAADFRNLVESNGMTVLSSHTGHNVPDSSEWESTMQWWDQCIDAHTAAGAKFIVQASMDKVAYSSLEGLKRYCDYFNAVGEKCNARGMKFGYHNHSKEFSELEGEIIYDFMLKNTDPSKVFFQMDLYWIIEGGGEPLDYFKKYPGRFLLYHVKDSVELGVQAKMDFKEYFDNASQAGAQYYIVEVEKYTTGNQIESVKQSLEFLDDADYIK